MFDRYINVPRPEVTVHNHIEQRPNDAADSARLYGQLRDKAEADVASALVDRLGADNEVVVATVETRRNLEADTVKVRMLFKINGRLHDVEVEPNREALMAQAYRDIAEHVANEVWRHLGQARRALSAGV